MEGTKQSILVPYDFSEKANIALMHAAQIADVVQNDLLLVYFNEDGGLFSSKSKTKQEEEKIDVKFKNEIENLRKKYNKIELQYIIRSGKLKSVIKSLENEFQVSLFVMGTEYRTESINFCANDFLGFIREINVPVIFTKQPPINQAYRELIVPVERDKKYKEELKWIIFLAKYYKCNVNLIRQNSNDSYIKKQIENNVYFSRKMLDANYIVYGIKLTSADANFKESIFSFANSIDADLIIIMSHKFKDYACDKNNKLDETDLTPVMVVNPRADLKNYQGFY